MNVTKEMVAKLHKWLAIKNKDFRGAEYMEGVTLYSILGWSATQKRILATVEPSPELMETLKYELGEIGNKYPKGYKPPALEPVKPKRQATQLQPIKINPKKMGTGPIKIDYTKLPDELKELGDQDIKDLKESYRLHEGLDRAKTDKSRAEYMEALKVMAQRRAAIYRVLVNWQKNGVIPKEYQIIKGKKAAKDAPADNFDYANMDQAQLLKARNSARSQISKAKKVENKKQLALWQERLKEIEKLLKK